MTAAELAQVWVEVPMHWRNIAAGDVIVGKDGGLWHVHESYAVQDNFPQSGWRIALHGATAPYVGDPDEVATVLLPAALRDAMELSRDELGARLLERRTA